MRHPEVPEEQLTLIQRKTLTVLNEMLHHYPDTVKQLFEHRVPLLTPMRGGGPLEAVVTLDGQVGALGLIGGIVNNDYRLTIVCDDNDGPYQYFCFTDWTPAQGTKEAA